MYVPGVSTNAVTRWLAPVAPRDTNATALHYWAHSALRGSRVGERKVCDYLAAGIGSDPAHPWRDAGPCYLTAPAADAPSLWMIGWMYETGTGVPQPDFPLAKRYYDQVLEYEQRPMHMAMFVSLVRLHVRALWAMVVRGDATAQRLFAAYLPGFGSRAAEATAPPPLPVVPAPELLDDELDAWVDAAVELGIFAMGVVLLIALTYWRRRMQGRMAAAQEALERARAIGRR